MNREEMKASDEENEFEDVNEYDEYENPNVDLINYYSLLSYFPKNNSVTDLMEKIISFNCSYLTRGLCTISFSFL